jgi:hypothetical protein
MRNEDPTADAALSSAPGAPDGPPTPAGPEATAGTPATEEMPPTAGTPPSGEEPPAPGAPARPGGDRRRHLVIVAVIVVLVVVTAVIAALVAGGDDDDTRTSAGTTSASGASGSTTEQPAPTSTDAPAAPGPTAAPAPTPSAPGPPAPGGLPDDPNAYAVATFEAWQDGDLDTLAELADPDVAAFLAAASPDGGSWDDPTFEGAAGSTYASWTRPDVELVFRVANQLASQGEPDAVHEAYFTTAAGRVAIWPLTTQAEADALQQEVDEGHQPWQADPAAVATAYAEARLGWPGATAATPRPDQYVVTDPASGARATLVLAQPARTGSGGIWVVTHAGSAS